MGIYLGKIFISYYGLMILIGAVIGFILSLPLIKKYKIDINDYIILVSVVALSCMLGSKILYCIINYNETILLFKKFTLEKLEVFANSGFVFYGGLILSLFAVEIIEKYSLINAKRIINYIFPIFVIAHGFGRIGCGIVGCCYGIEYDGLLSIHYAHSIIAPNNVGLFPTQYIEAMFQFLFGAMFYLIILFRNPQKRYIIQYLILYCIFRFFIEFYRGDVERGFLFALSTSQIISIILLMIIVLQAKDYKYFVRRN